VEGGAAAGFSGGVEEGDGEEEGWEGEGPEGGVEAVDADVAEVTSDCVVCCLGKRSVNHETLIVGVGFEDEDGSVERPVVLQSAEDVGGIALGALEAECVGPACFARAGWGPERVGVEVPLGGDGEIGVPEGEPCGTPAVAAGEGVGGEAGDEEEGGEGGGEGE
jgi:hypothetical protein